MTGLCFVDTNLPVYRHDYADPAKNRQAIEWMTWLWDTRRGRVSFQVLREFYEVTTRKLSPGLPQDIARNYVRWLTTWRPAATTNSSLERAWQMQDRYQLSWWDSLIVAAAHRAQCPYLLTEDLQHGQDLGGTLVVNPFQMLPGDLT
jgi:predicted nucleic acid-binding protein